jgi:hypothetical protein
MSECVSDTITRRMLWRGYETTGPKADIVAEIADTRVAFLEYFGVPADICICHETVVPRIPHEDGFCVRTFTGAVPEMQATVWYLGDTRSAR